MSDEQRMREQFEALRLPPDEWSQEVRDRLFKWDGRNYLNGKIDSEWHGFQDGYRARDAEVQALREALTEVTNELEAEVNHRYGFDPATGEVKGLARRYEVDISVVRMARAVLAGEEATDE